MPGALRFYIVPKSGVRPDARNAAFLRVDYWDDWGKYRTQFYLSVRDADGNLHDIGEVKIGQKGLRAHPGHPTPPAGHRTPSFPTSPFASLPGTHFSLGQEEGYYENLAQLGDGLREGVLRGLRDAAFDSDIWEWARNEDVMEVALLRHINVSRVEGQFRRMARGGARLTPYRFWFSPPKRMGEGEPPYRVEFSVVPESTPPTNVHVLIGRNGVGKTYLLGLMTRALVSPEAVARQSGSFGGEDGAPGFANLVTVSFSAFDDLVLPTEASTPKEGFTYSYIGLRRPPAGDGSPRRPKSPQLLATEFVKSLGTCVTGYRKRRWLNAIGVMNGDPVFLAASINDLILLDLANDTDRATALKTFDRLSSGHKIVLLTLTRLVETVEEKTLVLIDEPEAHLHPPLLSAFIRALSDLLVDRNGVAIVATHSPVVLQEVPASCVWVLSRSLQESKAERPRLETFGEEVGILSREAFQLELVQSGYQQLLQQAAAKHATYEEALASFEGHLGAEARAVLRALFLEKQQ